MERRKLFVFLPYKASMWDSLESIWMAAEADAEHCRTMVIPIPYVERDAEGNVVAWHNDRDLFPDNVPVIDNRTVDLAALHPDAIFIHNPYDDHNTSTSIDPAYYSACLSQITDMLVYVPYYVTSGGMGEAQRDLPAYQHATVIIAQSEYGQKYYATPYQDKLLPLGSPKLDKVVRLCANPPLPPEAWQSRMAGRTVYFYNTSINGMLADTERFLQKMAYVFRCFRGREDACLLWRPHPLLETTLRSLRPECWEAYQHLKQEFLKEKEGIYDTTPDIEASIALSDVYLGDSSTSVTALFGAAGKPLFILNNLLVHEPQPEDLRAMIRGFTHDEPENWMILPNNQLWHRDARDVFHFVAQLSPYHSGGYFGMVIERHGRVYVCPVNAQDILVFEPGKQPQRIALPDSGDPYAGRFADVVADDRYLFLIPMRYPYLVRLDLQTLELTCIRDVQPRMAGDAGDGLWLAGGALLKDGLLYLGSPAGTAILVIREDTLEEQTIPLGEGTCGTSRIVPDGEDLWLLPLQDGCVRCWNPVKGSLRTYDAWIDGFDCAIPGQDVRCNAMPFGSAAFTRDAVILSPLWGNQFVRLDKATGQAERWTPPEPLRGQDQPGYLFAGGPGRFLRHMDGTHYRYYHAPSHRLYDIDVADGRYTEIPVLLEAEELQQHASGFCLLSEWLQYGCEENALQTLPDLLDGSLPGAPCDADAERAAFARSTVNVGSCGEKVYAAIQYVIGKKEHA